MKKNLYERLIEVFYMYEFATQQILKEITYKLNSVMNDPNIVFELE